MLDNLIDAVTSWTSSDSGKSTISVAIAAVAWAEAAAVVGAAYFKGMIPLRAAAPSTASTCPSTRRVCEKCGGSSPRCATPARAI